MKLHFRHAALYLADRAEIGDDQSVNAHLPQLCRVVGELAHLFIEYEGVHGDVELYAIEVAIFHRAFYFAGLEVLGIRSRAKRTAAEIYGIRTGTLSTLSPIVEESVGAMFLDNRHDVFVEEYHRKIRIEGEVALEMVRSQIYPAAVEEFAKASAALESARNNKLAHGIRTLEENAEKLGKLLDELYSGICALEAALCDSHESIRSAHHKLRTTVDELELVMDDSAWPLPKYREMLFVY